MPGSSRPPQRGRRAASAPPTVWWRRRPALAWTSALVVAGLAAAFPVRNALATLVGARLVAQVERHFDGDMEARSFEVSLFPSVGVRIMDMTLRRHTAGAAPPLITVAKLTATTSLWRMAAGEVRRVEIEGLEIRIPAKLHGPDDQNQADAAGTRAAGRTRRFVDGLHVAELVSTAARLEIAPDEPEGVPLVFDIPQVRLQNFSLDGPATYEATVMNPRPRGVVRSVGRFGPWQSDEPRRTPLAGEYTLSEADMSVFGGLDGTLDSTGRFEGVLESIRITGTTTMPDFVVETGLHPLPLDTTFEARVDGTNGNTYLDRVSARLAGSTLEAVGEIAGLRTEPGKTVRLDVRADAARLEDFLFLVISQPESPLSGEVRLQARIELPPGDAAVPDRLRLNGEFTVDDGRFASDTVQDRVDELSRRGRGRPRDTTISNVLSDFSGRFTLRDGRIGLTRLRFGVDGAGVRLNGTYTLRGERLDFAGELRLRARLSQTTTGFKSILLKVIDPFFARHGAGAVLPIRIGGTVAHPELGLRLFGG